MMLTHRKLVALGARWMKRMGYVVVITELGGTGREEPDVIGWNAGGNCTVLECKVSRADFLADRKKAYRRDLCLGMGMTRLFVVPAGLVGVDDLPGMWGLTEVGDKGRMQTTVNAMSCGNQRNVIGETRVLLGALRRIGQRCPPGVNVKAYSFKVAVLNNGGKAKATIGVGEEDDD